MSEDRDEERDLTAAEYVLGVLDPEARRAAEQRLKLGGAFAREVDYWERRLGPLVEVAPAAAPPRDVWKRIEQAITAPVAALASRRGAVPSERTGFWRAWAIGASGLAAASIAALAVILVRPSLEPEHHMLAMLRTQDGATDVVVAFDTKSRNLTLTPIGAMPPPGMTPHLWLKRKDGAMRLVGPVDMGRPRRTRLPVELARDAEGATALMVSLDPEDAGRLAAPMGPVVARGRFALV